MQYRTLGRTGFEISEVGFGAWAIGGSWGEVTDDDARGALDAAGEAGVTFYDTADVYGDGLSERRIGRFRRDHPGIVVATKAGRRLDPHVADGYTAASLEAFVDRSLQNLATEALDLVQLHCPPTDVYYRPEVFEAMDRLVEEGKVLHYGVSVEKVEEGLKAIEYPGVETVQIIFNIFRQRPAELFFREAAARDVGVIVRVPLASGLLTGRMTPQTTFAEDDHRNFNRRGEAFDVGETFAGVDYDQGLAAVAELAELLPDGVEMAAFALRWILMFPAVSVVIPGARNARQAAANAAASDLPPIAAGVMEDIGRIYTNRIAPSVHHRW